MTPAPAIRCSYTHMVPLSDLRPNPANPNKHSAEQIALLSKIVQHQGWRSPVIVSKRSGMIVAGHGRYEAAKAMGLASMPVDYQDFDSDADELAHLVADNRLAELADTDETSLNNMLAGLKCDATFDMDLTGFGGFEIAMPSIVELTPMDIQKPPTMAWALIGIPIEQFAGVQALLDQMPKGATIHTTANNG